MKKLEKIWKNNVTEEDLVIRAYIDENARDLAEELRFPEENVNDFSDVLLLQKIEKLKNNREDHTRNFYINKYLEKAVRNNDISKIKILLNTRPYPSTIINAALSRNNVEGLKAVLDASEDPKFILDSIVEDALVERKYDIIRAFDEEINYHGVSGEALARAAHIGDWEILEYITANAKGIPNWAGEGLYGAAQGENYEVVKYFLKNNKSKRLLNSSLEEALLVGNWNIIQLLLDNGADLKKTGDYHLAVGIAKTGNALLMDEFSRRKDNYYYDDGFKESLKYNNYKSADFFFKTSPKKLNLNSILNDLLRRGEINLEAVLYLIQKGALLKEININRALSSALEKDDLLLAKFLLESGADLEDIDPELAQKLEENI